MPNSVERLFDLGKHLFVNREAGGTAVTKL
jgi:hypothetical protein